MEQLLEREGRQREYKEILDGYRSLIRTVVAFSNDIGGRIVIGVRDKDRAIVGLTEQEVERYLEDIPKAIYDAVTPACRPLISSRTIGGKKVIEIEVFPGGNKPYYILSQGLEKGVFIRIGAHTKLATADMVQDLQRERERRYYDEELISAVGIESFDRLALRTFYETSTASNEILLADKVIGLEPVSKSLRPTVAGILFFHPIPRSVITGAEILFSHLNGSNYSSVRTTMDLSAPLPIMVTNLLSELRTKLTVHQERKNARLSTVQLEVPELAIREALLNALVHRKYTILEAVKVSLFSDRLEIFSPGNFPGPITDLHSGISYTRNPTIRQLARKAGLVEKRGWGFSLIFSECQKNRNPEPQIEEGADFVKVTFWRHREQKHEKQHKRSFSPETPQLPPHLKPLASLYQPEGAFQTSEVMKVLKCSENTARARIRELLRLGLVEAEGSGRARRYRWR